MSEQIRVEVLKETRRDLKYLLNRGYNKPTALKLVGDRYQLSKNERSMLFRSVLSDYEAEVIKSKAVESLGELRGASVTVDGFNVLNTVEATLRREALMLCDDGVLRDFSEIHHKYKVSSLTEKSLREVIRFLRNAEVGLAELLFEEQISRSGEVAGLARRVMKLEGLEGDAKTIKSVDSELMKRDQIIATSDSAVLLKCRRFIDIPKNLEIVKEARIITLYEN